MKNVKTFEEYSYEDFTMNDMEMVQEYWEEGFRSPKKISKELDLPVDIVVQIIYTLKKRGDIEE
jgi:hypothetical protein